MNRSQQGPEADNQDLEDQSFNALNVNPDEVIEELVSDSDEPEEEERQKDQEQSSEELQGLPDPQEIHLPGPSRMGRHLRPELDAQRVRQGIDPADVKARKKGVSNEEIFQFMVAMAAKQDENSAAIRNILSILKRIEEAWAPTKSSGRAGGLKKFWE